MADYIIDTLATLNPKELASNYSGLEACIRELGKYAILSHQWGRNEILYSDLLHVEVSRSLSVTGKRESEDKLNGFFSAVISEGCRYAWFDTGCIDKSNGPEVDESIRSMFAWYRNSHVCIVYLRDTREIDHLENDEWYRRGWTLQELLAPSRICFFTADWTRLTGSDSSYDIDRTNRTCNLEVQKATRYAMGTVTQIIGTRVLYNSDCYPLATATNDINLTDTIVPSPGQASKMFSFLRVRGTTRPEDIAYCLLSLLDIHIPIVYGEGAERAFYRLQVACLQETTSRSLFRWTGVRSPWNSLLVTSPAHLDAAATPHIPIYFDIFDISSPIDESFTFNNNGIRVMMYIFDLSSPPISLTCRLQPIIENGSLHGGQSHLAYSLLNGDLDTIIELQHSALDLDIWHQEAVLAIYGWVDEISQAVILERGSMVSRRGYSRSALSNQVKWVTLPTATAITESGIQPQWIYVK